MGALSIEQVLAEETDAIFGEDWHNQLVRPIASQDNQTRRVQMNADKRDGADLPPSEAERREKFYRALNKLNRAALCCSGGGIRSATFCLGVIQALAGYDVTRPPPKPRPGTATGKPADAAEAAPADVPPADTAAAKLDRRFEIKPENSLLARIHYLSTVSGGGYVGSWLSSWRARNDFATVVANLTGRPSGADVEPPEISWLRAYSNYLTPRLGITSADAWAAVAISARNLVLNWLVIMPVVCLALLALKLVAALSVRGAENAGPDGHSIVVLIGAVGVLALIGALAFTTRHRPTRRAKDDNVYEPKFLWHDLAWAVISAITITIFFTSYDFARLLKEQWLGLDFMSRWQSLSIAHELLILTAAAGLLIYTAGWIVGSLLSWRVKHGSNLSAEESRRRGSAWVDLLAWMASGLIYGSLVGAGAYLFSLLGPYPDLLATQKPEPAPLLDLLLPMIFGVPWVLMAQMVADIVFVGLTSAEPDADSDREWLGRSAGWLAVSAIAWALMAFLVFAGGYFVQMAHTWADQLIVALGGAAGVIGGLVTALMGSSAKTPAEDSSENAGSPTALAFDIVMAVAGPIFAAVLVIALSSGLDKVLLDGSLVAILHNRTPQGMPLTTILTWFVIGLAIVGAVALLASYCVNINRFSLHALYRNRLIRGYLGASRQERDPDHFTGFDIEDNIRVHALWPPKTGDGANPRSLFHVVNIALNVVSTKRLAWQERKAEPFTVSPLHSGSAYLGFRPSSEYGDGSKKSYRHGSGAGPDSNKPKHGISLGTAMAISGAAVSPNMGYNSSPSITLLLTLFNVRLGWWLGNPGEAGEETYRSEGPTWAAVPLIEEAFSQTTDARSFVYLSDGGHFENLGLYEMVRRRCRFIIVVDAGCDPKFAFTDLGNAVRKIFIDLGIRITFRDLQALRNRPDAGGGGIENIPYYAVGTIHYKGADGEACENGHVLYVKPAYHGTEGAGIRSYATAHREFPHESTLDQWFTESQFESYRSLGLDTMNDILDHEVELTRGTEKLTLHQLLADLPYESHG